MVSKMTKLLIVSDLPILKHGFKAMFENYRDEFQVIGAVSNVYEAIKIIAKLHPDILIIDMYISVKDEFRFLKAIRSQFPYVKTLIMSESETKEQLLQAIRADVSGYVSGSVDMDELLRSLRKIMQGDYVLSPRLTNLIVKEFNDSRSYIRNLTIREREILSYVVEGYSNKEIAEKCFISQATVKSHIRNILTKLKVKNRKGAVAMAVDQEILEKILAN
ncbi:MAG: response regulator transcription factor [Chitinispirillaceae bacterium]|nr:response regulator transcription factor [Chitinispirillaceae bacterium]